MVLRLCLVTVPDDVVSLAVRPLAVGDGDCANATGAIKAQRRVIVVRFMPSFRAAWGKWTCSRVSNRDTLHTRQPAGSFSLANAAAIGRRAMGTIQKSFGNRCAGALHPHKAATCARRDAPSLPSGRPRLAAEQLAHRPSSQGPPKSSPLHELRSADRASASMNEAGESSGML